MLNRRSFLASLAAALGSVISWRPAWAQSTQSTTVTFVLVNDIYLMGDQEFPDGRRRGGFARLAAVVKDERARRRTSSWRMAAIPCRRR
jgi:5'-nucleotidase / UDP-sugar diphosphatase